VATCGSNAYGQLGQGDIDGLSYLTTVMSLLGSHVLEVASGVHHTLFRVACSGGDDQFLGTGRGVGAVGWNQNFPRGRLQDVLEPVPKNCTISTLA
jgi:hypothetical protein